MVRSKWTACGLLVALAAMMPEAPIRAQTFTKHVVVAQEGNAAEVGRDALRRGGNAVDAAVATAFALAVTHPAAGNLGGGGFLVAYDARTARGRHGRLPRDGSAAGHAADVSRPRRQAPPPSPRRGPRGGRAGDGPRAGLAHRQLGRLAWADLVRPAARLAREGFPVSATLARSLNAQLFDPGKLDIARDDLGPGPDRLADFPESVAAFRKADGTPWQQRRPADPARPGRHPRPDRRGGPGRVLHRQDRRADRRLHGRPRRPDQPRRPGLLPGPRAAARAYARSAASTSTGWARRPRGGSSSGRCSTSSNATTSKPTAPAPPGPCTG